MTEQNNTEGRNPLFDSDRRRLLVVCGATLVSGLAGCVGGERNSGDGDVGDDGARDGGDSGDNGSSEETPATPEGGIISHLDALGLEEGTDYEPEGYAVVVYSENKTSSVREEAEELSSEFDRYGTHGGTMVEKHEDVTAVVSVWDDKDAADTAKSFLVEIDGVFESVSGPLGNEATHNTSGEEGTSR